MICRKNYKYKYNSGFTLVEIMVALTVSLFILGGIIKIYASSKASYNLQSGYSRLQENARFALDTMALNISMAGYSTAVAGLVGINNTNSQENVTENTELGFTAATNTASDVIEINYQSAIDCLGNATGGEATDRYYIDNTNLMCLGNGSNTPEVLAEGIENLQILYGEDTDGDGIANKYVTATNVTLWNAIESVRIAILVSTVQNVGGSDSQEYVLLNTPPVGPFEDARSRRVFIRTILLRNPV